MSPNPCPICDAPGGFHDEGPHRLARSRIPAHLKRPSKGQLRKMKSPAEIELPGMWEHADYTGGLDEVRPPGYSVDVQELGYEGDG